MHSEKVRVTPLETAASAVAFSWHYLVKASDQSCYMEGGSTIVAKRRERKREAKGWLIVEGGKKERELKVRVLVFLH